MQDFALSFYDIMGYPVPVQEGFFAYQSESIQTKEELQEPSFKYRQLSDGEQYYLSSYTTFLKNIPFIEAVYLHGDMCFNPYENYSLEFLVISSQKRLRTSFLFYHCNQWIWNIWKKRKKMSITHRANIWIDEQRYNFVDRLINADDIRTPYRVAHLVEYYQSYPEKHNIFRENSRIQEYLPNIQQQSIHLGVSVTTGTSPFKRFLEKILSGIMGDIFESLLKRIATPIFLVLKKSKKISQEYILTPGQIWLNKDKRYSSSMLRKMFQKGTAAKTSQQ